MRYFKSILSSALIVCCLGGGYTVASPSHNLPSPSRTPLQPLDEIIARVNAEIITQSEFNSALQVAWTQQKAAELHGMPAITKAKLKAVVLESLVKQKLQLQMAKLQGISITDKQLDMTIANIAKQHKISTDQLYQEIHKTGLNKARYRKQIRNQLAIVALQRAVVGSKAAVTPAEIKAYQNAHSAYLYQVGDILIPLSGKPSKRALAKAQAVKHALSSGKNFVKVAQQYAPDNHTILSWRPITDLPDIFAEALQSTKTHQAAGPVRAPNGLHVLYLLGKKKNLKGLSDQQVGMILYEQKSNKVIGPWLKKLRKSSTVKIMSKP